MTQRATPLTERIAGALTAYACGDALGLPWEGLPPAQTSTAEIEALPARTGWARGATSDDTALTLLVAQHLAERNGAGNARVFLQTLAAAARSINGLGPSTTSAIRYFTATGEPPSSGGTTNGAPMRALPVGWATPREDPERCRRLTIELTRATHPDADAQCAACVVAACASWSLEGASGRQLLDAAITEEAQARVACQASERLGTMLASLATGSWQPPKQGISLDPAETVTAVLACAERASSLRDGLIHAVRLGGDTDTVAALTGGLLGARMTAAEVLAELPWHVTVLLPDPALVTQTSSALAAARSSAR
ncbi:MAG: ADP-ribosylglycohydrolase family protein [Pseudonocardiaceae bacterium]